MGGLCDDGSSGTRHSLWNTLSLDLRSYKPRPRKERTRVWYQCDTDRPIWHKYWGPLESGGLVLSALDSGSRGPGSSPGGSLCCVLGQDTLLSQCLSPPMSINGYRRNAG